MKPASTISPLRKKTAVFTGPRPVRGRRMCRDWARARFEGKAAPGSRYDFGILECHADANAASPNDAALLFHAAIVEFETLGHRPQAVDVETCAAGGVVDDPAGQDRKLRAGNDLAVVDISPDGLTLLYNRGCVIGWLLAGERDSNLPRKFLRLAQGQEKN